MLETLVTVLVIGMLVVIGTMMTVRNCWWGYHLQGRHPAACDCRRCHRAIARLGRCPTPPYRGDWTFPTRLAWARYDNAREALMLAKYHHGMDRWVVDPSGTDPRFHPPPPRRWDQQVDAGLAAAATAAGWSWRTFERLILG